MGLISRVSSRTYRYPMAEQEPIIGGPGTFPDPNNPNQPPNPNALPQNPAIKFLYDPANANLIAIFGWASILSMIYVYIYGTPQFFSKKSTSSKNYQQQESSSNQQSREDRIKKMQDELDKSSAERIQAKKEKDEEERRKKAEILREKHEAMQKG